MNQIYQTYLKYKDNPEFINLIDTNFPRFFTYPKNLLANFMQNWLNNRSYDPDEKGLYSARLAISNYYSTKYDFDRKQVDKIFITASTSESYNLLFNLKIKVMSKRTEILLPSPSYPLFEHIADFNNLNIKYYNLIKNDDTNTWDIDWESFDKNISKSTKYVVIISPNNPTGKVFDAYELSKIYDKCMEYNCHLIIDEVFDIFDYQNIHKSSISELYKYVKIQKTNSLIILLNGISKMFALPDLKLAWLYIIHSNNIENKYLEEFIENSEIYNDTYLNANYISQNILPELFTESASFQSEMISKISKNIIFLKNNCTNLKIKCIYPKGGIHAIITINQIHIANIDEFIVNLIESKQIFLHPAYFYEYTDNYSFVISLLQNETKFREGLLRFVSYFK